MNPSQLPNFLVIGAAKCGTTSLHGYLAQHPDIFMPEQKEIHFFLADGEHWGTWNRGVDWYCSLFKDAGQASRRGEASPGYTVEAQTLTAAKKMRDVLGSPKLIYFVREPIARVKSHYLEGYFRSDDKNQASLDEILSNRNRPGEPHYFHYCDYVKTSLYGRQMERLLKYHKIENIFVCTQENFRKDNRKILSEVFSFLEVDPNFSSNLKNKNLNITSEKLKRMYDPLKFISNYSIFSEIYPYVPQIIKNLYTGITSKKIFTDDITFISDETLDHLSSIFAHDIEHFRSITGIEINAT